MKQKVIDPTQKHSYNDFIYWPNQRQYEIINGVVQITEVSWTPKIEFITSNLIYQLRKLLELQNNTSRVCVAPLGVVLSDPMDRESEHATIVTPKIFVCKPQQIDYSTCNGAPDLIIEIMTPQNMMYDLRTKKALYESYGVKEYWYIQPQNEAISIFTLQNDGEYCGGWLLDCPQNIPVKLFQNHKINWYDIFPKEV